MDSDTVQPVKRRQYWSFIALLYSLLGWALFDAWLFLMSAGFLLHIFVAVPGAALVIRSALRPSIDSDSTAEPDKSAATGFGQVGVSCALLYILGAVFGAFVLNESLVLLGLVVVSFTFAPWAHLRFSRDHFALSCVITMSGFASVMAIGRRSINTMFLPLGAWTFWLFAFCALLFRVEQVSRAKRERSVTSEAVESQPHPMHSPG